MYIKVAVYIRKSGTREYEKANHKTAYSTGPVFCRGSVFHNLFPILTVGTGCDRGSGDEPRFGPCP